MFIIELKYLMISFLFTGTRLVALIGLVGLDVLALVIGVFSQEAGVV